MKKRICGIAVLVLAAFPACAQQPNPASDFGFFERNGEIAIGYKREANTGLLFMDIKYDSV